MISITEQFTIFTSCILAGFLSALIYDIFRAVKKIFKVKKSASALDISFWAAALCVFFTALILSGNGQMRGYALIGFSFGFVSYVTAVSRDISPFIEKFIIYLIKILKIIFSPAVRLSGFLCRLLHKIGDIVQNTQKKARKIVKKRLEKSQ